MRHNLYVVIALLFLAVLAGCGESDTAFGLRNNSEITIKAANDLYVSADRHLNNHLIADRSSAGEWEKYSIHFLQDNEITLRVSDRSFVGVAPDTEGLLSTGYTEAESNAVFKITAVNTGGVIFQDHRNMYVGLNTDNSLRASKEHIEDAHIFFLTEVPVKKFSHFSFIQLVPLITGLVLLFISLVAFQYNEKKTISIILLLLGGFSARLFTALLSSHLHWWDEQFHALVAKNMISHPFMPMLYKNPVLPYDETSWTGGHIWLHKQPLFLWQMALSMKLFGENVFALRLPSVIMSTIVIFFIYRLGALFDNKTAGFFGALLFALSNFVLEISAGAIHTDHNDVAFLFYTCASIWAWVEYENSESSGKKYFLILAGLLSGCAILVKWLTGLLVFSGWGLSILLSKERRGKWIHYRNLLLSVSVAATVFLPWQIYILNTFPVVSQYEFLLNSRHFFEVIEGHEGDFWWHFDIAKKIYGVSVYFILFCVVIFLVSLKNRIFKTAFATYVILVYLFFGIAATKMIAFTFCVSFIVFLAIGAGIEKFMKIVILNPEYLPRKIHRVIYTTMVLGIISGINLNIEKIQETFTMWKKDDNSHLHQRVRTIDVIKNLPKKINPVQNYVIFNCRQEDTVPIMFFTDVIAAYSLTPDYNTYYDLKMKGIDIAVFDNGVLPSYLAADQDVIKVSDYWTGS